MVHSLLNIKLNQKPYLLMEPKIRTNANKRFFASLKRNTGTQRINVKPYKMIIADLSTDKTLESEILEDIVKLSDSLLVYGDITAEKIAEIYKTIEDCLNDKHLLDMKNNSFAINKVKAYESLEQDYAILKDITCEFNGRNITPKMINFLREKSDLFMANLYENSITKSPELPRSSDFIILLKTSMNVFERLFNQKEILEDYVFQFASMRYSLQRLFDSMKQLTQYNNNVETYSNNVKVTLGKLLVRSNERQYVDYQIIQKKHKSRVIAIEKALKEINNKLTCEVITEKEELKTILETLRIKQEIIGKSFLTTKPILFYQHLVKNIPVIWDSYFTQAHNLESLLQNHIIMLQADLIYIKERISFLKDVVSPFFQIPSDLSSMESEDWIRDKGMNERLRD